MKQSQRGLIFLLVLTILATAAGCHAEPEETPSADPLSEAVSEEPSVSPQAAEPSDGPREPELSEPAEEPVSPDRPAQTPEGSEKPEKKSEEPEKPAVSRAPEPARSEPPVSKPAERPAPDHEKPSGTERGSEPEKPEETESEPPEEPASSEPFDIDDWIAFGKACALKKGLALDEGAVECWDNPMTASAKTVRYLERDLKDRLTRYAAAEDITEVWIWAEPNPRFPDEYLLFVGYA